MKFEHLENGSLIVSKGPHLFWIILGFAAFLVISKDAFIWAFERKMAIGLFGPGSLVVVLAIVLFFRLWSLRSRFKFDSIDKCVHFHIQHPFSSKDGIIPISTVKKVALEVDNDGSKRLIMICDDQVIPMSSIVESQGNHQLVCDEVNSWLDRNS